MSRFLLWMWDALVDLRVALRGLLFRRRKTPDWRGLRRGPSRVDPWVCPGRAKTSAYSVTMVRCWLEDLKRGDLTMTAEFGVYVDKHGDPSRRMGTVEWEGKAERVAWHPPYILLFGSRFIEIRHVETGRLVQIIPGNDIRCIWDGRGASQYQVTPDGAWDEVVSQQPKIHGVMNMEMDQAGGAKLTVQHVFELVPKIPLS